MTWRPEAAAAYTVSFIVNVISKGGKHLDCWGKLIILIFVHTKIGHENTMSLLDD